MQQSSPTSRTITLSDAITHGLPPWDEARRNALLEWLVGRGELIRLESRESYAFGHFTFQEFFAARHFRSKRNLRPLLARAGDPWWREVLLLLAGLLPEATKLLEELRSRDLLMAGAALTDARVSNAEGFVHVAQRIVRDLQERHRQGDAPGLEAAATLARIPGWGTRDYLLTQAQIERGLPALTAFLALLPTLDPGELRTHWPKLGPLLQRLHRGLGIGGSETDQAILAALDRLGFPLVFVPAGEFLMGSDDRTDDERPRHTLRLPDYWIGKYPVTNAQFADFVAETRNRCEGDLRSKFTEGKDRHPVVYVSWHAAIAFCQWAGLNLPSEAEWEKAARGSDGREYPWGNDWDPARCNTDEGGRRGTSPVGDYPNGTSPYGCHDMAGNVYEWTRSIYRPYPYNPDDGREVLNASGNASGTRGVWRGCSWSRYREDARCASRGFHQLDYRFEYLGFRVVSSPSGSASSLRSAGGV